MKTAIIAVAGVSSRFNDGAVEPVLKGIYTTTDYKKTLLYSILRKCKGFDKVVLVGGYQYHNLENYVQAYCAEFPYEIKLVCNPHYEQMGTGYTLKLGLEECLRDETCLEIMVIEGDLFFDEESFETVKVSENSIATYNYKPIYSSKAVIAYIDQEERLRYVFSTSHGTVQISEPFLAVFNSGQLWKFRDVARVRKLLHELPQQVWEGTNLQFIEAYFSELEKAEWKLLPLEIWENCNTRSDYLKYAKRL